MAVIAKNIHLEFGAAFPIISNGNISSPSEVSQALAAAHPCCGVMSAEGVLANPAIFHGAKKELQQIDNTNAGNDNDLDSGKDVSRRGPSLLTLFRVYCMLTEQYREMGGWIVLDAHFARSSSMKAGVATVVVTSVFDCSTSTQITVAEENILSGVSNAAAPKFESAVATASMPYVREPRQMYIARQHLCWMLGKSGHGRLVRFQHIGSHEHFRKHVHLMQALNSATTVAELLDIAEKCLS